ncbi:hypothetical protein LSTR_LSTR005236 [Laodelphax striatellus]|uniref:NADH dehydrogenase [ubiquinone] 1 beta subcomplex subunit 10 n=1 Tax=Laodelphax striatellus TaxID=195883 RepID=A0A482XD73_LAOST|nr:hypothetical protein LSTR_LSTR005236 [Laodelphax striatellus]
MTEEGKVKFPTSENLFVKSINGFIRLFEAPGDWFRKTVVEPNQQKYPYYHEKFRRVPTIDQCYDDDVICKFEADQQFLRDRKVDSEILHILRARVEDCFIYEGHEAQEKCKVLQDQYAEASTNWFTKYGDLGAYGKAEACYFKQKHRLIWERRHGEVGTGMKGQRNEETAAAE